ncbi:MAG: MopE-related protein, partial [Planctomycetota bacterium]
MRPLRWLAVFGLAILLNTVAPYWAQAQTTIKPKILILFDTSGSMRKDGNNVDQGGDGSPLCSSQGQNSRIYALKAALFDALQGMGAEEVDFALATFPMYEDATRTPYCGFSSVDGSGSYVACQNNPDCTRANETCVNNVCTSPCAPTPSCSGHYYTDANTLSEHTEYNTCNPIWMGQDCRYACKVSAHNPTTQTNADCGDPLDPCSAWYSSFKSEVLRVPFFNSTPEKILVYFDQQEDAGSVTTLANPEIRAGMGWNTPLGKSLFYAHGYFHKEVVLPDTDYRKDCERLTIAFFTDGAESCNNNPSDPLNPTQDPYYPTHWAGNLYSSMKVVTHTIGIDTPTGTNSLLQDIASSGHGTFYPVSGNTAALKQAFMDIVSKSQPPKELCNGLDDDCDNVADEDFPLLGTACNNGQLGACYNTGTYVCRTDETGVECNAVAGNPTNETCNGIDDDCNGKIDDVVGGCPPICVPQPEICNGIDDDCNTFIDDNITPTDCGKDIGECKPGQTQCVGGNLICVGGTSASTETCNNLDDNCDGTIDDITETCYDHNIGCTYDPVAKAWNCDGYCSPGTKLCTLGIWGECTGDVGPASEECNCFDDDCDGVVDNDATCPQEGAACINCECALPCGEGEFKCPSGYICNADDYCVADPCDPDQCDGICVAGTCIDPCENITCGKYEECQKGACVDTSCFNPSIGCPAGEQCVDGVC